MQHCAVLRSERKLHKRVRTEIAMRRHGGLTREPRCHAVLLCAPFHAPTLDHCALRTQGPAQRRCELQRRLRQSSAVHSPTMRLRPVLTHRFAVPSVALESIAVRVCHCSLSYDCSSIAFDHERLGLCRTRTSLRGPSSPRPASFPR